MIFQGLYLYDLNGNTEITNDYYVVYQINSTEILLIFF